MTVERGGERSHLLALAAALFGEPGVLALDHLHGGRRRPRSGGRRRRATARSASAVTRPRSGPRHRPRGAARSRRCAVRATAGARGGRRCAPRDRAGATRAPRFWLRARRALDRAAEAASASACSSASSAGSTASSSAMRAALAGDVIGQLGDRPGEASSSALSSRRSPCTLASASAAAVKRASLVSSRRASSDSVARAAASCSCASRHGLLGGARGARPRRPTPRAPGRAPPPWCRRRAAPTRQQPAAEAVAGVGHDDGVGMGDRDVDRGRPRRRHGPRCRSARRAAVARPGRSERTCGRTGVAHRRHRRARRAARRRRGRRRSCRSREGRCNARLAESGPSTTTAVSASPSAASTAGCQPSSISMRSSSVPSTPSTPARRSAPARARATSSACCNASTRADQPRRGLGRLLARLGRRLELRLGAATTALGPLDLGDERRLDDLGVGAVGAQPLGLGIERRHALTQRVGALGAPAQVALAALDARCESTAARRGPRRPRSAALTPDGSSNSAADASSRSAANAASSSSSCSASGASRSSSIATAASSSSEAGGIGLEVGDDAGVEQLAAVALHRPAPLDRGPRPARVPARATARRAPAGRRRRRRRAPSSSALDRHHRGVEPRQLALQLALELGAAPTSSAASAVQLGAQAGDLAAGRRRSAAP